MLQILLCRRQLQLSRRASFVFRNVRMYEELPVHPQSVRARRAVGRAAALMPIFASAPDGEEAVAEVERIQKEVRSVLLIQEIASTWLSKARARAEERAAEETQRALAWAVDGAARGSNAPLPSRVVSSSDAVEASGAIEASVAIEASGPSESDVAGEAEALPAELDVALPFTIRNLDTHEATIVSLEEAEASESTTSLPPSLRSKLSFGELQPHTPAWDATKNECRGVLEKLASRAMMSFRSHQLCVWQERFVYAADDALCYQQLNSDSVPSGRSKRIPYSSIQFVGPVDETQFVIRCARRSYTFLSESLDARIRWIQNISMLSGCSASLHVCLGLHGATKPASSAKGRRARKMS